VGSDNAPRVKSSWRVLMLPLSVMTVDHDLPEDGTRTAAFSDDAFGPAPQILPPWTLLVGPSTGERR